MKSILITTALLLSFLVLSAQENLAIEGIMYDSETSEMLADGHVYIDGTHIGAISNQFGYFKLEIPDSRKDGILKISFVGYKTVETSLKEIKDSFMSIAMVPAVTILPEIVIYAEEPPVITKATERIRTF